MAADAALPLCRHGTATGGVQEWLVMTGHLQQAPDRLSRSASDSEQGAVLHRTLRSNGLVGKEDCPTGPTRKKNGLVVWSTKASRTPCTPCSMPATEVADFHPPRTLDGTRWYSQWTPVEKRHRTRSFRARSRCWTVRRRVPRRPALQRHSRSAPAGVYDLIAPATGYCATASCVRITYRSGLVSSIYHRAQQRPLRATAQNRPPVRRDTYQLSPHVGHEKWRHDGR
jgi:hypothetical protein